MKTKDLIVGEIYYRATANEILVYFGIENNNAQGKVMFQRYKFLNVVVGRFWYIRPLPFERDLTYLSLI